MSFETLTFGRLDADTLLVQMVDEHDLEFIEKEVFYIKELSGTSDFCLSTVKVKSWNQDLSPWNAPAVFGKEDFGNGAVETLEFILNEVLPDALSGNAGCADLSGSSGRAVSSETSECAVSPEDSGRAGSPDISARRKKIYLGGYSLAGLFALWAGFQTDCFSGIAAASPSVWFPHFTEYMRNNPVRTEAVYLSLGDREERTKNPVMSRVGIAIREAETILKAAGKDCILEWNSGNHFKEPDLRTARAFAWLMNRKAKAAAEM